MMKKHRYTSAEFDEWEKETKDPAFDIKQVYAEQPEEYDYPTRRMLDYVKKHQPILHEWSDTWCFEEFADSPHIVKFIYQYIICRWGWCVVYLEDNTFSFMGKLMESNI